MSSKRRTKASSIIPILIIIVAGVVWIHDTYQNWTNPEQGRTSSQQASSQSTANPTDPSSKEATRTGAYETYQNCTLNSERSNDGDSFRVKLPNGRAEIIRLYFVDCPESDFKTYGGGRNNHDRIAQQANEMNRITSKQAVDIGKKAKKLTIELLSKTPFTLHTAWDSPFNDQRYHGFIQLNHNGKSRLLHELLVEKGYARIHTKGAKLPNGTSQRNQEDHLYDLEDSAKSKNAGAWGL